jgi:DNA-binding NtrC family response regulator
MKSTSRGTRSAGASRLNDGCASGARGRVLVVDDHAAVRESVIDVLRQAGYEAEGLASAVEALPLVERGGFDVVITDLQMPGIDGLEFIRQMSRRRLAAQAIMITAHATIASAVEAMRFGAFDYLE